MLEAKTHNVLSLCGTHTHHNHSSAYAYGAYIVHRFAFQIARASDQRAPKLFNACWSNLVLDDDEEEGRRRMMRRRGSRGMKYIACARVAALGDLQAPSGELPLQGDRHVYTTKYGSSAAQG